MNDQVAVVDVITDRAGLRGLIGKLARAAGRIGQWDAPLFRFTGPHGRNIISAAIYRAPGHAVLFVWLGHRVYSLPLKPAVRYAGRGF